MLNLKGSYTIEAAIWVPILLLVILLALKSGISLYMEIATTDFCEKTKTMDVMREFYKYQGLEEIIQEATDD